MERFEFQISHSSLQSIMRCPRAYYFRQMVGLEPYEMADHLKIGNYVDAILGGVTETEILAKLLFQHSTPENSNITWLLKAKAMVKAVKFFGFDIPLKAYKYQEKFELEEDGHPKINGFIDFSKENHFIEWKTTARPEFYTKFALENQLTTYFLSNSRYEFCALAVVRVPKLKQEEGETNEQYFDRCYNDMINSPSSYFLGAANNPSSLDVGAKRFGTKFYREEFDPKDAKSDYRYWADIIIKCIKEDRWPQIKTACDYPYKCDYKRICETGVVSHDIYKYRNKKNENQSSNEDEENNLYKIIL